MLSEGGVEKKETVLKKLKNFCVPQNYDYYLWLLPLMITCDASPNGIGAVLSHKYQDNSQRPVA